jgi:uncharacterized integral membrane protein (TIGR00697 family)
MTSRISSRAAAVVALLSAAYIAAQMLADVTSLKIAEIGGLSVDAGTMVYPFTFTIRDLVHKAAGKQVARTLIFAAATVNLFMAGLFWVAARLPADLAVGPQTSFGDVLAPVWRIVFASIIAEVVSELIDTEAYSAWTRRFGERHQWGRVLASNAVAIPIDSIIFATIAFLGVAAVGEIFLTNVIVKVAVTFVSVPLIYAVRPALMVEDRTPEEIPPR